MNSENMVPVPVPAHAPASPLTVRESNVDAKNGAHSAMLSGLVLFVALIFSRGFFVLLLDVAVAAVPVPMAVPVPVPVVTAFFFASEIVDTIAVTDSGDPAMTGFSARGRSVALLNVTGFTIHYHYHHHHHVNIGGPWVNHGLNPTDTVLRDDTDTEPSTPLQGRGDGDVLSAATATMVG